MNGLVKPIVPPAIWERLPHFCQSWLRNFLFAAGVYFGVGFIWAYYIYHCFGSDLFPKHNVPTWRDMFEQMNVSLWSLPMYSLLPSITEELCANGCTLAYAHVKDVGRTRLFGYLFLYMGFVEFGVYWMHRGLHDIPAGYKCALIYDMQATS
jgi:Delta7-sterol 5-desaturase